jgi:hypothetical protein
LNAARYFLHADKPIIQGTTNKKSESTEQQKEEVGRYLFEFAAIFAVLTTILNII